MVGFLPGADRMRCVKPRTPRFVCSRVYSTETVKKTPDRAALTVKRRTGRDELLPMRLGPVGWQYSVGEGQLAWLTAQLAGQPD